MIAFDHINIQADDQAAVRDFLCAALGLKVGFRPDFGFEGYWLYLDDKAIVHMQAKSDEAKSDEAKSGAARSGDGWVDHFAFGLYLLKEETARLDAAGLDYFVGGIPGSNVRQIFITGPEGVKIELQCHE